jgi:hypothetical protein
LSACRKFGVHGVAIHIQSHNSLHSIYAKLITMLYNHRGR